MRRPSISQLQTWVDQREGLVAERKAIDASLAKVNEKLMGKLLDNEGAPLETETHKIQCVQQNYVAQKNFEAELLVQGVTIEQIADAKERATRPRAPFVRVDGLKKGKKG